MLGELTELPGQRAAGWQAELRLGFPSLCFFLSGMRG